MEAFQKQWLLAIPFLSGPRWWMNALEADRQEDPKLWAGSSPPTKPGDKHWVLYSKRGDRMTMVCPKAFDSCVFGTLVVMPGFFKRWPETRWHFEKVAPGDYLGVGGTVVLRNTSIITLRTAPWGIYRWGAVLWNKLAASCHHTRGNTNPVIAMQS